MSKKLILLSIIILVIVGVVLWCPTVKEWYGATENSYTSDVGFFTISYPRDFEIGNGEVNLPFQYHRIFGVELNRNLDITHCGESGLSEHCTPFTPNPSIILAVVDTPYSEMITRLENSDVASLLENAVIAGVSGKTFTWGIEGEGQFMYFLPLKKSKFSDAATLVIVRNYIDENNLLSYKDVPDFLTLEEQREIFEKITSTLTFE